MIARPALDAVTDALRDVVEPREAMEILATRGLLPEGFDVEVIAPVMPRGAGVRDRRAELRAAHVVAIANVASLGVETITTVMARAREEANTLVPDGDITIAWQVSRVFDFGDAPSPYTFVGGTRVVETESVAVAGRGGSVRVELHVPPVEGAMDLEPRPPLPHHPWRGPVDTRDFQRSPMQVWFA